MGIAGFIGAGKSSVTSILAEKIDAIVFDGDQIAKDLMDSSEDIKSSLSNEFDVINAGVIDYRKLGAIVFSDIKALKKLNSIVHPPLIALLNEKISSSRSNIILDAALLPLWESAFNLTIALWVDVQKENRLKRIMSRNGINREEAMSRIDGQAKILKKPSCENGQWMFIDNNGTLEDMILECEKLGNSIVDGGYNA